MGVTYAVMCLDCGDEGPEVGDFGYIGYPSLDKKKGKRHIPNFGYIYSGLRTLGLLTPGVEEMREFLEKHRVHTMDLACEGESMFEDDQDEDADEDLDGDEDDDDDDDDDSADDLDDDEDLDDEDFDEDEAPRPLTASKGQGKARFKTAHFTASCVKCKTTLTTTGLDEVLAFSEKALTPAQVRDAWPRISGDEFYDRGAEPFGDDLPGIAAFLKKHAAHSVTVGLRVWIDESGGSPPRKALD